MKREKGLMSVCHSSASGHLLEHKVEEEWSRINASQVLLSRPMLVSSPVLSATFNSLTVAALRFLNFQV